jgi:uncharacterized protein
MSAQGDDWWFPRGVQAPDPTPFDTFLLKIASRCNLACPYCYVYYLEDQSWRGQPALMAEEVFSATLRQIRKHILVHRRPNVNIIFHGGEPLLVGPERLGKLAADARSYLEDITTVRIGLQTNGILLNSEFVDVLLQNHICAGLSIDGPPRVHDSARVDHRNRGTSELVERAASLLGKHRDIFGGILCVVNLEADPKETYNYFADLGPSSLDLLLPHATHDHLPPGIKSPSEVARYGDWLVRFLDSWYSSGADGPEVRLFSSVMRLLLRKRSLVEVVGLEAITLVVIETNGEIQAVDTLKACYAGAASTGLNVFEDTFNDALRVPAVISRQMGAAALCRACQACPFLEICGGGYQPHRFSAARGFLNPSVYCQALQMLIRRTAQLMQRDFTIAKASAPEHLRGLANARYEPLGV